jgi:hypothetical protein
MFKLLLLKAMVRKNAAAEASISQSVIYTGKGGRDVQNDDRPSRKTKKRQPQDTIRCCIVVSVVVGVVVLSLVVIMTHSRNRQVPKYASSKLLRRNYNDARNLVESSLDGEDQNDGDASKKSGGQAVEFLPPNSVYKVSMESITGDLVDLSKYRGLVSLIVNVACL